MRYQMVVNNVKDIYRGVKRVAQVSKEEAGRHKKFYGALGAIKVATWVPVVTAAAHAAGLPIPTVTVGTKRPLVIKEHRDD